MHQQMSGTRAYDRNGQHGNQKWTVETFRTSSDGSTATRIDYIYVPKQWLYRFTPPTTEVIPGTDHRLLITTFMPVGAVEHGPGRWQMPTTLLYDTTFRARVEAQWTGLLEAEAAGADSHMDASARECAR